MHQREHNEADGSKEVYFLNSDVFSNLIVHKIINISRVTHSRTYKAGHTNNRLYYALYLKLEGRTTYRCGTHKYISDPNHMVLLPKGSSYDVTFDKPGDSFLLEFDADFSNTEPLSIPIKNPVAFVNLCERMERLWLFKKPSYLPKTMTEVYRLFTKLDELMSFSYVSGEQYRMISSAVKYLEEHYTDPNLRMDEIYLQTDISESYFRRIFKDVYHVSPVQYINSVRIEKAKALLMESTSNIYDIATATGFTNPYHFSKTFHQLTNMTPSEFRKKHS